MTDTTNETVDAPTEGDVEETYTADESGVAYSSESAPSADAPPDWCGLLRSTAPDTVPHAQFKALCVGAKAVVRTGECTPYTNVLLYAGVVF